MAPKKVKHVVHTEYACDCGTTIKNVTDASIELHLNGAATQADDAYNVRTCDGPPYQRYSILDCPTPSGHRLSHPEVGGAT